MPSLQEVADRRNLELALERGQSVDATTLAAKVEVDAAHERITRLEGRLDGQGAKIADVDSKVSWIKGYLEQRSLWSPSPPEFRRDAGMVIGGGGVVGAIMVLLEWFMRASGGG